MTAAIDANVLLYAADDLSPFQERSIALIEHLVRGPAILYMFWPVVAAFLRIGTNSAVFARPLSPEVAMANIEGLLARPHVRFTGEIDDFWAHYREVADDVRPRGNLVPDAHLVALMHQHGVVSIWSHDRDLRKFRGITVRDPFDDRYSSGFE